MYFVNRSEIEKILHYYDDVLSELGKNTSTTNALERFALERMLQVLAESVIDTGSKMIDGFIMRDPGSYHDIIDVLTDEEVLPEQNAVAYKALIDARQHIVKQYDDIDTAFLKKTILTYQEVWQQFSTHIRTYLDDETGVANAFTKESESGDKK